MDLSQKISEMAESYDPEKDSDAQMVRALIQGMMVVSADLDRPTPPLRTLVKIAGVEQEKDKYGDYLPYYTLVMQSGTRIRVTLEVEEA